MSSAWFGSSLSATQYVSQNIDMNHLLASWGQNRLVYRDSKRRDATETYKYTTTHDLGRPKKPSVCLGHVASSGRTPPVLLQIFQMRWPDIAECTAGGGRKLRP
ncbi:hypothetical protein EVAR_12547_1 [Eumeta japonica]|uniref:Uncharacterized protein n=1 Tax=Eumeta variegata TaxID=151549 RepID=A0A4C1TPT3_EUMVA|nr:hypothetical protein EVAR_12547_1 [Eumeta japonica]